MSAEDEKPVSDEKQRAKRGRGRPQQASGRPGKNQNKETQTLEKKMAGFVACGRCSFSLAGYRVIHGPDSVDEALSKSGGKWLNLQWDTETQELLHKSYGWRLDISWYHIEACCPECRRRFVYNEAEAGEETQPDTPRPGTLRVALTLV